MNYKAAIFDLDGTLLNTIDDIRDSMNAVLGRRGFAGHSVESYKFFVGDGMKNLAVRALPENARRPELIEEIVIEMEREYGKNCDNKTAPYPGIIEMLGALAEANVRISVLSNKPHIFTEAVVRRYFKDFKFEHIIGASGRFEKKPDPAAALYIARDLDIPVSKFVYAGDSNTDMATARNAKMFAAGVSWGFRPERELKEAGADVIIDRPEQILKFFTIA